MAFLLDTCLLSEVWKPAPNAGVVDWLAASMEDDLFLSVLSLGELKRGIALLPDGRKKLRLLRDYGELRSRFSSRVLPVTDAVAERWGDLAAAGTRGGRHVHVVDGMLAATALVHGLTLVTRNVRDVAAMPVPVVNPWT
jgi:predicted nucleic acid-binding protein